MVFRIRNDYFPVGISNYLFLKIETLLIYTVVLISCVQKSDLVIYTYFLFHILFHNSLSQDVTYSSLCNTGPCCLSILWVIVYIC